MKKIIAYAAAFIFAVMIFSFSSCHNKDEAQKDSVGASAASETSIVQDAKDAYLYGFPLVLMHLSERVMTNPVSDGKNSPLNRFKNVSRLSEAQLNVKFRDFDGFRSYAWVELGREPVVFELPDTRGRYELFEIFDGWNNLVTSAGSRSTGTKKQLYLLTAPGWKGTVPDGMTQIKIPTEMAYISGSIRVLDNEDGRRFVLPLQNKLRLVPLSRIDDTTYILPDVKPDETIDMSDPAEQIFKIDIAEYFNLLNALMSENPPSADDSGFLEKIRYLKISPNDEFDLSVFDKRTQDELKKIPQWAKERLTELSEKRDFTGGWSYSDDKRVYGTDYLKRALSAFGSIGASSSDNAIAAICVFDSEGNNINGANRYAIHFDKDSYPPENTFWSLAVYDPEGAPVKTVAVAGRKSAVSYDSEAGTNKNIPADIYVSAHRPAKGNKNNWLYIPANENFVIVFRLYPAKDAAISKSWKLPPVVKMNSGKI